MEVVSTLIYFYTHSDEFEYSEESELVFHHRTKLTHTASYVCMYV